MSSRRSSSEHVVGPRSRFVEPVAMRRPSRSLGRRLATPLALVALCLFSGFAGAAMVASGIWGEALSSAGVDLPVLVRSSGDVNVHGAHVRLVGDDGNFEFEHGAATPVSRLNAYVRGTGRRTPIAVGVRDGQDVVELIVRGPAGRASDLQEWVAGGRVVSAIDRRGRLRLGNVALSIEVHGDRVDLVATLPSGKRDVLAWG